MDIEKKLVEFVVDSRFEDIPQKSIDTTKDVVLDILGGIIAAATIYGCPEVVEQCKGWGGKKEATIMIYGGRVPVCNAAFANSFMARSACVDMAIQPGLHVGGSTVPTGLAIAELVGGCSGRDFLTALVLGTEVSARINAGMINGGDSYHGFDATGLCAVFAVAAITGRILGFNSSQMWNALGHAFNRSAGSFQGTVDHSVGAMVLQAQATQGGIISAQLAQRGITGPTNFLDGIYGYYHLYAGDKYNPERIIGELGKRFELDKTIFKKFPSCAATHSSIDIILELIEEAGVTPEDVAEVNVAVRSGGYNLTGMPFDYGDNPKINAMYNIQYCVANALLRKSCKLRHFDEALIREPAIMELTKRIHVCADPALEKRNLFVGEVEVKLKDGTVYHKSEDYPRGVPENPLTREELMEKFYDCVNYGGKPLPQENIERIVLLVSTLEKVDDVRSLIPLLLSQKTSR